MKEHQEQTSEWQRQLATAPAAGMEELAQPAGETAVSQQRLEFLEDVDLEVAVQLGRTRMPLGQVLTLVPGAVLELDRLAGDPVDILVNERLIGHGEIVVVEDRLGVRVTEIIPPDQRWKYR